MIRYREPEKTGAMKARELFDIMRKRQLASRRGVDANYIMRASIGKLVDSAQELAVVSKPSLSDPFVKQPAFCADIALAGGYDECTGIGCRLEKADRLARFAALYADRVIIPNFFADYSPDIGHPPTVDSESFRERVADDVRVLLSLKPILESGLVELFTPPEMACAHCLAPQVFGIGADKRLFKMLRKLEQDYRLNLSVTLEKNEYGYLTICSAPERLLEHGEIYIHSDEAPEEIAHMNRLLAKLRLGEKVPLSQALVRRLSLDKRHASIIFRSILYQLSVGSIIGTRFLTHRQIQLDMLRIMSANPNMERRNQLLAKHLQTIVPFVSEIGLKDLLRLRHREEGAFLRFRGALNTALKEATSSDSVSNDQAAYELYSDVIAPRLAELDQRVRQAKKDLIRRPLTSALGVVGVLTMGFFTGLLPNEIETMVQKLGLAKVLFDTTSSTLDLSDVRRGIRQDDMYFLWQVRKHVRKRSLEFTLI